ncbi:Zn(2)-C6 fungal-type domain-containing protein [Mycena kentingensis (nom. inval.)]|nr:Zn(2)-C6 fungal-type domain-containing protein [Mycena kentingensis (nom. inval.)]
MAEFPLESKSPFAVPKRVLVACLTCRRQKVKCLSTSESAACIGCQLKGVPCEYRRIQNTGVEERRSRTRAFSGTLGEFKFSRQSRARPRGGRRSRQCSEATGTVGDTSPFTPLLDMDSAWAGRETATAITISDVEPDLDSERPGTELRFDTYPAYGQAALDMDAEAYAYYRRRTRNVYTYDAVPHILPPSPVLSEAPSNPDSDSSASATGTPTCAARSNLHPSSSGSSWDDYLAQARAAHAQWAFSAPAPMPVRDFYPPYSVVHDEPRLYLYEQPSTFVGVQVS